MHTRISSRWLLAGAIGLAFALPVSSVSYGAGDPPKPSVDCSKRENRNKPACKNRNSDQSRHEEIYAEGFKLAKAGEHAKALTVLRTAPDQSDARVLTMIGFSLRKQGQVDEAMGYYARALEANPNLTSTRQYLGEAHLQKGEPAKAKEQLAEIGKRCGATCEDYQTLAAEIAKHEKRG
jgi:tetratricopeptide (TPR) repeat protein